MTTTERRNQTALGRKRRREFERSVQKLRDLGMPEWAVEYYRRTARVAGLPPHMVVCHVAVVAAGRQIQAGTVRVPVDAEARAEDAGSPSGTVPSYQTVRTMRQRVSSLLREIQRQGSLLDAARDDEEEAPTGPSKLAVLRAAMATSEEAAPSRPRRRGKSPSEGH